MVKDNFVHKLGQIKEIQNEHNSVKDTIEKGEKKSNIDVAISMKILLHYPPMRTCTRVLFLSSNGPIRLTQCCTQFKSPGDKILCVFYLHYNVVFTFK